MLSCDDVGLRLPRRCVPIVAIAEHIAATIRRTPGIRVTVEHLDIYRRGSTHPPSARR
ncbi:hypothetical protein [Amycolatopsis sp. NPDC059020]|uniref:hypothetical protein n=1 Tax=Amycolatopsis sp. NPDC059020 TaxID=3346703 RepID=UPI00366F2F2F